jgi:hypothetical protein
MEFIPKGLNSLKIQANFKLEFFLDFIINNPFGFLSPDLELARGPLARLTIVRHSHASGRHCRPHRPPPPPRPRAPPAASSRTVTLIPSPLWPIDEAKSLFSSFARSSSSCAPAPLAATTAGELCHQSRAVASRLASSSACPWALSPSQVSHPVFMLKLNAFLYVWQDQFSHIKRQIVE